MKIVTTTDVVRTKYKTEDTIRMIADAGFDGADLSLFTLNKPDGWLSGENYKDIVKTLKNTAAECEITFEQSHAPFPCFRKGQEDYNKRTFDAVVKSLEISGELGISACVVHPTYLGKSSYEFNMEYYNKLLPYAKEYNVKIAVENMWKWRVDRNWITRRLAIGLNSARIKPKEGFERNIKANVCSVAQDFNRYIDDLDSEYFTACLDLGHCGLVGEDCADMIRQMGSRITCLHIHDNDNLRDLHTLPYTQKMDWDSITQALADIDYKGNFTYEADNFLKMFPYQLYPDALKFMASVARHLAEEIESKKINK